MHLKLLQKEKFLKQEKELVVLILIKSPIKLQKILMQKSSEID